MTQKTQSLFSRFAFAGTAIPLVAAVSFWQSNMDRVAYEDALPTIAFVIGLSLGVMALLRPVAGGWIRANLMAVIAAIYVIYFSTAVTALSNPGWVRAGLLVLGGALAVDLARRLPRDRSRLLSFNRMANMIALPIVLAVCAIAVEGQISLETHRPDTVEIFPTFKGVATADSPDVWHFILDRYAGNDTLRRVYHYDNRPFLAALAARGFEIREHAYSNYQRTAHSVSSTLNGAYLDRLAEKMAGQQTDWVPLYRAMTDNAALRFFASQGYTTIFAGSWWNPTSHSFVAGRNINYRAIPELGRLMLDNSLFGLILKSAGLPYGDARIDQCLRAQIKFDALAKAAAGRDRKYVFAHFLVPHPPYVLNADGTCRSLDEATKSSRRDNYVGQILYANAQILRLIDKIEAGPRPAIIIVHADEGPWPLPFVGDERFPGSDPVSVDWPKLNDGQLHEKMGVLLAVRTPRQSGVHPSDLPQSAVNLYPTLLRNHFAGTKPNWPDRHYLFVGDKALYTFDDVTARLRDTH